MDQGKSNSSSLPSDITVIGTFSANDENDRNVMEKVLHALLDTTRDMLTKILKFAALRCRRDHLWGLLFQKLPGSFEERHKDASEEKRCEEMTIHDLKELLGHVHIEKLDIATKSLKELAESSNVTSLQENISDSSSKMTEWQNRLIRVFQEKYWQNHRLISSDNGQFQVHIQYYRISNF